MALCICEIKSWYDALWYHKSVCVYVCVCV